MSESDNFLYPIDDEDTHDSGKGASVGPSSLIKE
jgi:hypothetical protein